MTIKDQLKETFRLANSCPPDNMKAVHLARLKIFLLMVTVFVLVIALAAVTALFS